MIKLFYFVLLMILSANSFALERRNFTEVSIQDITSDTQAAADGTPDNEMDFVWWVPFEYWKSVSSRDPGLSGTFKEEILQALENYTVIAVVQADISPMGAFDFYPRGVVQENLSVSYRSPESDIIKLAQSENISQDMELLMSHMSPILRAAMGNMGSNIHFFIYDDIDKNNERIVDPYKKGKLSIHLKNRAGEPLTVNFKTPLNSLFIPRICPNGEKAHVSWNYCPWSGKKL